MRPPWIPSGAPLLDRAAERRTTVDCDRADAVLTRAGGVLMEGDRLAFLAPQARPTADVAVFLGTIDGRDLVAIEAMDDADTIGGGGEFVPLRAAFRRLGERPDGGLEREVAATAVAMTGWHATHARCETCGVETTVREGGWSRRCPEDERDHYPRTDPAVIVAITDEHDRLLLAHVGYHTDHFYSHLAGFVEPGESLEQAAHREVGEEGGLVLTDLEYVGSQSWPFPASMMAGFRARARADDLEVDGVEVTEAMWVTREELVARIAQGDVFLAQEGTIARHLIHEWFGGAIDAPHAVGRS